MVHENAWGVAARNVQCVVICVPFREGASQACRVSIVGASRPGIAGADRPGAAAAAS